MIFRPILAAVALFALLGCTTDDDPVTEVDQLPDLTFNGRVTILPSAPVSGEPVVVSIPIINMSYACSYFPTIARVVIDGRQSVDVTVPPLLGVQGVTVEATFVGLSAGYHSAVITINPLISPIEFNMFNNQSTVSFVIGTPIVGVG